MSILGRNIRAVALMASALAYPTLSMADAIKCVDAKGKSYITNGECPAATRIDRSASDEHISAEQQRQAREVWKRPDPAPRYQAQPSNQDLNERIRRAEQKAQDAEDAAAAATARANDPWKPYRW